ncbi:MAG: hypothetical protein AB7O73_10865 [Bacteroidia bacterium]
MKKLLSITDLLLLFFLLCSCQTSPRRIKENNQSGSKSKYIPLPHKTDSAKTTIESQKIGQTNLISEESDSSTRNKSNFKSINNSAPNQTQIDSLKKVKTQKKYQ